MKYDIIFDEHGPYIELHNCRSYPCVCGMSLEEARNYMVEYHLSKINDLTDKLQHHEKELFYFLIRKHPTYINFKIEEEENE